MSTRTIIRREVPDKDSLPESMHPVLRRVFASRRVLIESDLDYSLKAIHSYQDLKGIGQAVALLSNAIKNNNRILIVADFDVDGATGCALAVRCLKAMGARQVDYIVPSRFDYGYGLSAGLVQKILESPPDLIVTVDNGISCIEGVSLARENGIDVLITDHHLPGKTLPDASAIVNPNVEGDIFPSKSIAGVGVMFYTLAALRSFFREDGWFTSRKIDEPVLADYLDVVALGTVADVVSLDRNNRILVEQGIRRIRSGQCCAGILALIKVGKRDPGQITASDFGFVLGPRLNAAGRLEHMSLGIECLLTDDAVEAENMARELDDLNQERKQIQQDMQKMADQEMIKFKPGNELPPALCLYKENWHQGIVGILASRIKDNFHRPVIVFAREADGMLKGSGRSIEGVHIRDVLESVFSQHPGLINKFGGHAMAAGLSLAEDDLSLFTEKFQEQVAKRLSPELLQDRIISDGELCNEDIEMSLAEQIVEAGPWGQGFPEPMFDGVFRVHERKILADAHLKLSVSLDDTSEPVDAIAFYTLDKDWPDTVNQVEMAYRLNINEFRGVRSLQFIVEHIIPVM